MMKVHSIERKQLKNTIPMGRKRKQLRIEDFSLLSFFKILNGGNVTKSILHFHPRPTDHGKTLTCRAENTELSHAAIEDHWKLVVHCKYWH